MVHFENMELKSSQMMIYSHFGTCSHSCVLLLLFI